jgi:hypothetical protein
VLLGPHHAGWRQLYEALATLAKSCGGAFAFVLDEGNGLWCVGIAGEPPTVSTNHEDRAADRFYDREMVPKMVAMRRGARLHAVRTDPPDLYVGLSFASIYAVVVWSDTAFDPALVSARIRRALPEIERFTLALPPSDDPGTDAGAAKARA